ncbi:MAG: tRNA pseudouridine(55) synthase TruB [Acetobacteraceae bacterium]|nr:tRNA pseudouridine(55) synthase TruB [Acetobacteraceae bacterium]
MNGVLNLLKPPGCTAHSAVLEVRRLLGVRAGHAGTLDPDVAGVLPVLLGSATRLAEFLLAWDKGYRAEVTFGAVSDTGDWTGSLRPRCPDSPVAEADLVEALPAFLGEVEQVPPMVSAVKVGGVPLYRLARQGRVVERPARRVRVFRLDLVRFWPGPPPRALLDIVCSKGTYVRALCQDLGLRLGCGAYMSYLVRTRAGPLALEEALTLAEAADLKARGLLEPRLLDPARALEHLPPIRLDQDGARRVSAGGQPVLDRGTEVAGGLEPGGLVRLLDPAGRLVAVAEGRERPGRPGAVELRLRKVLAQGPR